MQSSENYMEEEGMRQRLRRILAGLAAAAVIFTTIFTAAAGIESGRIHLHDASCYTAGELTCTKDGGQ
jgi:hypothetical protein